jgi:hypothetical protein
VLSDITPNLGLAKNKTNRLPPLIPFYADTMPRIMTTDYKQLVVWQKSIALIDAVYDETETFPKKEIFSV